MKKENLATIRLSHDDMVFLDCYQEYLSIQMHQPVSISMAIRSAIAAGAIRAKPELERR